MNRRMGALIWGLSLLGLGSAWGIDSSVAGSGNWSDPASWSTNQVPTAADPVTILPGDTIIVDVPSAQAGRTNVQGTLSFSRAVSSALTLTGGDLTVENSGTLDLGTEASPIPSAVTATLTLARGNAPGQYGLLIQNGAVFTVHGAAKGTVALATADVAAGATQLTVPAAQAAGWAVGDTITIGATERTDPFSDQTEERTIAGPLSGDPVTVSWAGALSHFHRASSGIRVANLTRNVVVRSSGTDVSADTAYIHSANTNPSGFRAVHGEFLRIGAAGQYNHVGIYFEGSFVQASISSSTFHGGKDGILMSGPVGGSALLTGNVICRNNGSSLVLGPGTSLLRAEGNDLCSSAGTAFSLSPGAGNILFSSNTLYSNDNAAIFFVGASSGTLAGNRIYANEDGIFLRQSTGLNVTGNEVFANRLGALYVEEGGGHVISSNTFHGSPAGLTVNASSVTVTGNTVRDATIYYGGMGLFGNAIHAVGNHLHDNSGGVWVGGSGNILVANDVHNNAGVGLSLVNAQDNLFIGNHSYSNAYGSSSDQAFGNVHFRDRFGINPAGAPAANAQEDVRVFGPTAGGVVLKEVRLNPFTSFTGSGVNEAGSYNLAYNLNADSGTVRLYGDYLHSAGAMTLDQGQPLYTSTATPPLLMRGTGHAAQVLSTQDANAVAQLVTVLCLDGASNQWRVEGSASGVLAAPFTGGLANFSVGSPEQFRLTFTPGGAPRTGDRLSFALLSASPDQGLPKKLLFGDAGAPFNGGRSQLTVAPGASLTLRGTAGQPARMERLANNFYTFVGSGALTLQNAAVTHTDHGGLQLAGSQGVAIASTTFDHLGNTAATLTYLTLNALASNATFYNVAFNDTPNRAAGFTVRNVTVQGADASLRWFFSGFSGPLSGDERDLDPNQKVLWADAAAPDAVAGFAAVPGSNTGEISLAWTAPADREDDASPSTLRGGSWRIFRTTSAADLPGASPTHPLTVSIATTAAAGASLARVDGGLLLGTSHYYRLWAADEFGNLSAVAAAVSQPARTAPFPPANFTAVATADTIDLSWTAPANPPAGYLAGYDLEVSTVSSSTGFTPLAGPGPAATSYTHGPLPYETDHYYRLTARDTGAPALLSAPAAATARTADVVAPQLSILSIGPRTVGVSRTPVISLAFTKPMQPALVSAAVAFRRTRDNMARAVDEPLGVAVSSNAAGDAYTVIPPALAGNSTYELVVATSARDAFNKPLDSPRVLSFSTLLDRSTANVVLGALGARAHIPARALARDGYVEEGSVPPSMTAAATRKLKENTGDARRSPLGSSVVELKAYDGAGAPLTSFASPVTVSLPFPDADGNGIVDGSVPPVKVKTLSIHWLDEAHGLWVRLPTTVDAADGRLSAPAPHFTVFAAIGLADADLANAHPFPTPFKPSLGDTAVTFTDIGQGSRVQVFTASGGLVWEGVESSGGQLSWDVRNQDGVPAASGVYLYRISNGSASKTGKLAVVR